MISQFLWSLALNSTTAVVLSTLGSMLILSNCFCCGLGLTLLCFCFFVICDLFCFVFGVMYNLIQANPKTQNRRDSAEEKDRHFCFVFLFFFGFFFFPNRFSFLFFDLSESQKNWVIVQSNRSFVECWWEARKEILGWRSDWTKNSVLLFTYAMITSSTNCLNTVFVCWIRRGNAKQTKIRRKFLFLFVCDLVMESQQPYFGYLACEFVCEKQGDYFEQHFSHNCQCHKWICHFHLEIFLCFVFLMLKKNSVAKKRRIWLIMPK